MSGRRVLVASYTTCKGDVAIAGRPFRTKSAFLRGRVSEAKERWVDVLARARQWVCGLRCPLRV